MSSSKSSTLQVYLNCRKYIHYFNNTQHFKCYSLKFLIQSLFNMALKPLSHYLCMHTFIKLYTTMKYKKRETAFVIVSQGSAFGSIFFKILSQRILGAVPYCAVSTAFIFSNIVCLIHFARYFFFNCPKESWALLMNLQLD